jgi:hypothetical protein
MAGKLNEEIQSLVQRSGASSGNLRTEAERAAFASNVRKDIAALVYQLNTVHKQLVQVLSSEQDLNALDFGLSGNVIYTHVRATKADADAYWSDDQGRARTIKETIDLLLSEIARLENEIQQASESDEYDDSELRSLIHGTELDLVQLAKDSMGVNYTLDGDGLANLNYSLAQVLDSIGPFFTGYVPTGNVYNSSYPTMSLDLNLSDIVIDTTLAQSVIAGLPADLTSIRTFVGMDSASDSTPDYSFYGGTLVSIADGDSLEEAIWKLDQAGLAETLQATYDNGGAGTAGDLALLNAKGIVRIKDDTVSPLDEMLSWIDSASATVGKLEKNGLSLAAERWLEMAESTGAPAHSAGLGRLYSFADPKSAATELFYRNDVGADSVTQVSRDGIVKELEVGHTTVRAQEFKKYSADAGPSLDVYEMTDYVVELLNFSSLANETAYSTIPIPLDENGKRPSSVQFVAHIALGPNSGPYPGGTGVEFKLYVSGGAGTPSTVGNKQVLDFGWDSGLAAFDNTLSITNIDNLVVLTFAVIGLTTDQLGLLNLKLQRNTASANDSWDADCGLIALHATWYR